MKDDQLPPLPPSVTGGQLQRARPVSAEVLPPEVVSSQMPQYVQQLQLQQIQKSQKPAVMLPIIRYWNAADFAPDNPNRMKHLVPAVISTSFRHPLQSSKWVGLYLGIPFLAVFAVVGFGVVWGGLSKSQLSISGPNYGNAQRNGGDIPSYFVPTIDYRRK